MTFGIGNAAPFYWRAVGAGLMAKADGRAARRLRPSQALRSLKCDRWCQHCHCRFQLTIKALMNSAAPQIYGDPDVPINHWKLLLIKRETTTWGHLRTPGMLYNRPLRQVNLGIKNRQIRDIDCDRCFFFFFFFSFFQSEEPFKSLPLCSGPRGAAARRLKVKSRLAFKWRAATATK